MITLSNPVSADRLEIALPRLLTRVRLTMAAYANRPARLALVAPSGQRFDAEAVAHRLGLTVPTTFEAVLQDTTAAADAAVLACWEAVADDAAAFADQALTDLARSAVLFARPGKIVCIGQNYRRHAEEMGAPLPTHPVLFSKFNNALAGPDHTVVLPDTALSYKIDYETELVVVLGGQVARPDVSTVMEAVAGYCTGHDLTARDLQKERGGQWLLGKTLNGFAPVGPDFVGAALVPDPHALRITTRRNGILVQDSSTADLIFNIPTLLSYIGQHFPLEAGDLLFTGTPEGVIAGKPAASQRWLGRGEQLESSVGDLGVLRFRLG